MYEYWVAEMLVFYLGRYEEGIEFTTRLVTKCAQDIYLNCPVRARIFITLIAAYYELDALSYSDEIWAMIHTMETSIPLDEDTHQRLFFYRAGMHLYHNDYDNALAEGLKYIEICNRSAFRAAEAYDVLCHIRYLQGANQQAFEYAHLCQEACRRDGRSQALLANSLCWQASLLAFRGETEEAERLFLLGTAQAKRLNLPDEQGILKATCRYYDVIGAHERSLALWDEQIRAMNPNTAGRQTYFEIFLRRCFTLRKLDRLTEGDIEQTRQAAQRMRKPEPYLACLNVLFDGKTELPLY
jgi:hypothetical protein